MHIVASETVDRVLDHPVLIEALREMFRAGCTVPVRHHHTVPAPGDPDGVLLLMPAWREGRHIGVKTVTVFPGNTGRGVPAVQGVYMLLDGVSGVPLTLIDAPSLTARRTGAVSALAAGYLARADARRLLVVGAGAVASQLIPAHRAARPIAEVLIWNRSAERGRALAQAVGATLLPATEAALAEAVREADIVSTATISTTPLIKGAWLKPGAHLDLVGSYRPDMRESDDEAVRRARLFVDTRGGALKEAGDIVDPIRRGVIAAEKVEADLFDLCRGIHPGRRDANEITLFKSVGTALADLAAAELVWSRAGA
jgi:alanine dehydrogenase